MESPILASMRWILNEQYRRVRKLEEENENLKEENVRLVQNLAEYKNEITDLKEENRKLKEERDKYYAEWHLRHS